MTNEEANLIVKTIKQGNDVASIALLKTFGIVKLMRQEPRKFYKWDIKR